MISKHLDKNNLHHAYLIEGARDLVLGEILDFVKSLGVDTEANPDFVNISVDSFKVEDARNLKSFASEKAFSDKKNSKKVFVITANSLLLEAQNSLLKIFEEPIKDTVFFVVIPDINSLLKTLVSRFYVITDSHNLEQEIKNAEKFINMTLPKRIDFIKELLVESEEEDEEGNEVIALDSTRSKALKFLNALEAAIHGKLLKNFSGLTLPGVPVGAYTVQNSSITCLQHFFKVREFLRMPGASVKTLMESVALVVPEKVS